MQSPNYLPSTDAQKQFRLQSDILKDQVIMITGATGGFGTALSKACAQAGASVIVAGRNVKKLESLYDVLTSTGSAQPAMIPLEQDKAGPTEYGDVADMIDEEFGRLDGLIHSSADLGTPTPQMAIDHSEWLRVMNVNLTSARLLSLYTLPLLMKSRLGSLLFMLDHKPSAYWGSYGVSKMALQSFMHMLADETDNHTGDDQNPLVAINGYDPGPSRTPLRRRAFPGELETESVVPEEKIGPILSLLLRVDRSMTGSALSY